MDLCSISCKKKVVISDFINKYLKYSVFNVFMLFLGPKNLYKATKTIILSQLVHVLWYFYRFSDKTGGHLGFGSVGDYSGVTNQFFLTYS